MLVVDCYLFDEFDHSQSLVLTGKTPLQVLVDLEKQLEICLTDDSAFELETAVEALQAGKAYERADFSTPEDNFTLSPQRRPPA